MSEPAEPPVWKELTIALVSSIFRNSCCSLPALRQVSVAFLRCSPVQQAVKSLADALSVFFTKLKSCNATLPVPPPPPLENEPALLPPNAHDASSISPVCDASVD